LEQRQEIAQDEADALVHREHTYIRPRQHRHHLVRALATRMLQHKPVLATLKFIERVKN
jgi:hypothetical protein